MNIWIGSFHVNVGYRSMYTPATSHEPADRRTTWLATYFTPGVICTPVRVQRIHAARSILPAIRQTCIQTYTSLVHDHASIRQGNY